MRSWKSSWTTFDHRFKEEGENGSGGLQGHRSDPLVLGPEAVTYFAQVVHEREQEWQEMHQQDVLNIQQ